MFFTRSCWEMSSQAEAEGGLCHTPNDVLIGTLEADSVFIVSGRHPTHGTGCDKAA